MYLREAIHTLELLHDFAQALADLGVDNAIYLVGSSSYSAWKDTMGRMHFIGRTFSRGSEYEYENFIQWVAR